MIVLLNMQSSAIRVISLLSIVTLLILVGEAIVYRILRMRFHRMLWVWTHIAILYLILLILPLAYLFGSMILPHYLNTMSYAGWIEKFALVQRILFWSGIAIGHFFFVLTIVYGFRKKKIAKPVQNEPSHLLDEFHE